MQVRLYDVRAKRRPVYSLAVKDTGMDTSRCRFTCMALDGAGRTLMLGDVVGGITRFDLRKRMAWGAFKGGPSNTPPSPRTAPRRAPSRTAHRFCREIPSLFPLQAHVIPGF